MSGAKSMPGDPSAASNAPDIFAEPKLPATSGPRALLGFSWVRAEVLGYRLDLGWQLPWTNAIALRGYLSSLYSYDSVSMSDLIPPGAATGVLNDVVQGEMEIHELALFATAEIDAALVSNEHGRFGVGGAFGLGPSFAWVKMPDMPFQPGEWTHARAVIGRLSGHIEYRFASGWVLRGQPFGLVFSGHDNTDTVYEMTVMGGYQW